MKTALVIYSIIYILYKQRFIKPGSDHSVDHTVIHDFLLFRMNPFCPFDQSSELRFQIIKPKNPNP